jgi:hypothetical protein
MVGEAVIPGIDAVASGAETLTTLVADTVSRGADALLAIGDDALLKDVEGNRL